MAEAGAASGATVRTGSVSTAFINATVAIIAHHEATLRQRQVAEERGRAWTAHRAGPAQLAIAGHAKRHARYIAVDTAPDSRTPAQARKSVMIFDTEADQVVGKNVYEIQSPPPEGAIARFETYSAQYIGPGY
jgi:hypothetical protein